MKLVVGLGNLGDKYIKTRHNIGWLFLDYLASKYGGVNWQLKSKLNAEVGELVVEGDKIILAKPQTFMNLSGDAVVKLLNFYKLDLSDLLVVYDDIDLAFASTKLRLNGSGGTHNGLKDIVRKLKSQEFSRLKLGIESRTDDLKLKWNLSDYVLADFVAKELDLLSDVFGEAEEKMKNWLLK